MDREDARTSSSRDRGGGEIEKPFSIWNPGCRVEAIRNGIVSSISFAGTRFIASAATYKTADGAAALPVVVLRGRESKALASEKEPAPAGLREGEQGPDVAPATGDLVDGHERVAHRDDAAQRRRRVDSPHDESRLVAVAFGQRAHEAPRVALEGNA